MGNLKSADFKRIYISIARCGLPVNGCGRGNPDGNMAESKTKKLNECFIAEIDTDIEAYVASGMQLRDTL